MNFDESNHLPLFEQVAEQIEAAILSGAFPELSQIPSTTEISKQFQINPATVLKGMNLLVDKQIIEKRTYFFTHEISQLVVEAKRLDISLAELIEQIESGYQA